ncbi:MAG: Tfp pilus assembly protein FimT/FimU [Acidobacteriota bacterium]
MKPCLNILDSHETSARRSPSACPSSQAPCAMPSRFPSDRNALQTHFHTSSRKQRGFTLMELILVLVVVAMFGMAALSRSSTVNTDAFSDGENLKGALRNARTRAMADIVSWSFTVVGQTGTLARNGVAKSAFTFETAGVAAGTTTFDYRGQPTGTMSYAVSGYTGSPVTVTPVTGFVP